MRGHFGYDNMGSSFGGFVAYHKEYPHSIVFGDYQVGVYSENKEALEKFTQDHPPHQAD